MKKFGTVLLLVAGGLTAQEPGSIAQVESRVRAINAESSKAFSDEDAAKLTAHLGDDAVFMPEFCPTLYGKAAVADYLRKWFNATNANSLERTIYEILRIGEYIQESGTFAIGFSKTGSLGFTYKGKYLRVWKTAANGKLLVVSEIQGATANLDRSKLPALGIAPNEAPAFSASSKTENDVLSRNQNIARMVQNRKGADHAKIFATDAIYMPYFMPMLVGIDAVTAYFIEHEGPGVMIDSIQIKTGRMLLSANFVIENGLYRVNWRAGENKGLVTGKSINIWKRETDGELRIFRQMVNHD